MAKRNINDDLKRARNLAARIHPGDGFVPSQKDNIAKLLLELLNIVGSYDDRDDRDYLIYGVGEVLFTNTFEGHRVIGAYVDSARPATGQGKAA